MYVGNVTTPTLLITGEKDLRTPMEQTEQYYSALKLRKIPTAMIRLTDGWHSRSLPRRTSCVSSSTSAIGSSGSW